MASPSINWQLLFGLLALQTGLVSSDQLVVAFSKRANGNSTPIDEALLGDGALDVSMRDVLVQMVDLHVTRHGGDPQKSLAAIYGSDLDGARAKLEEVNDSGLLKSLATMDSFAGHESSMSIPPTSCVGQSTSDGSRFRILRPLAGARGGMGVVSVAHDNELDRIVALKQILPEKSDHAGYRQKFQVEAEITGNLEHPGIVPIYGLGVGADGRPYYAMRLVHGDNLGAKIKQIHGASDKNAVDYNSVEFHGLIDRLIDVAQAIRYAHSRGVLHRDLKPGNILVGEYGETLVIDWGLARIPLTVAQEAEASTSEFTNDPELLNIRSGSNVDATMQGQVLGTVGYAPPEQLDGRVDLITERSDVYALGAILYQILVGKAPISIEGHDRNLDDVIKDTIAGRITPPRRINRSIFKSLSAVCMHALERAPEDRYESVAEFIAELERWKADQPVAATPDSIADRVMRLARHYRAAALATAATLLGIAIVAGMAIVLVNHARVNEAEARGEAEALASRNQTVVDSFVAAFRSPDPENEGVTAQMTALEVLEQALAEIETDKELAQDDLTKATLLDALGKSLASLGAYGQAISAHAETVRVRKTNLGLDDPLTLESMDDLAIAYSKAGQLDKALPLKERMVELRKTILSPDHPSTLNSMNNLACTYQEAGLLDKALRLHEKTLELMKAKLGLDDDNTRNSMNNLAIAYREDGQLDKAIELWEQELELTKAQMGPDHPSTLTSMGNLANAYTSVSQLDKAMLLEEQALKLKTVKLGADHPSTLTSMGNLATIYELVDLLDRALPLHEQTLRRTEAILGPDHPNTLARMSNLANAYQARGQMDKALPLFEKTLEMRKAKLGADHPDTLSSMDDLGIAYRSAGQLDKALALHEQTLKLQTAKLGPDHPNLLAGMNSLANAYHDAGQLDKALRLYKQAVQLAEATLGPDHPNTLIVMNNLASSYLDAEQPDKALAILEQTLVLMNEKLGSEHFLTLDTSGRLGRTYLTLDRISEAMLMLEPAYRERRDDFHMKFRHGTYLFRAYDKSDNTDQAVTLTKELSDSVLAQLSQVSSRLKIADQMVTFGRFLLDANAFDDAIPLLRASLAIKNQELPDKWQTFDNQSILGAALLGQQKYAKAKPLLLAGYQGLLDRKEEIPPHLKKRLTESLQRLVQLYESWHIAEPDNGYDTEAADWKQKLEGTSSGSQATTRTRSRMSNDPSAEPLPDDKLVQ